MKEKIEEKIHEIYKDIKLQLSTDLGLLVGKFGFFLFLNHYTKYFQNESANALLGTLVSQSMDELNEVLSVRYSDGFAGIGWVLNYLIKEEVIEGDLEVFFESIDEVIMDNLHTFSTERDYDFLHGMIGLGMYLLERKNHEGLSLILEQLEQHAIRDELGCRWNIMIWDEGKKDVREVVNLSMAHGSAGTMVFLSKCSAVSPINQKRAKKLLEETAKFILNSKLKNRNCLFPTLVELNPNEEVSESRLAWCHGDLGISLALWQAGETLNSEYLRDEAITIGKHSVKRRGIKNTGIMDAGFCHGTAGLAQMYKRLYDNTGEKVFFEAANYWINETLKMATHKNGIAGYKSFNGPTEKWFNDPGLLEGTTGVGLVLLAHIAAAPLNWDRCFLLS